MKSELSAAKWFKSSYSSGQTECVEVAWLLTGAAGVRDSKNTSGPTLRFEPEAWDDFTKGIRAGGFESRP
ncbi:DUF397 domain-containing protein [Nocardia sienata]|uniref:DUF397 domain-containing protein n=1 Tax=Nocardia sienata TaxID=248552 RepID=UPI0009FF26FB|nr:DUF397 domain-containing protein [Nocardia sienata]